MSLGNATNDKFYTIISPTINLKNVGLTTIFTVPATVKFIPIGYTMICDTATSADNFFTGVNPGTLLPDFPSSTAIKFNLTMADTGTALTGRFVLTGFYI